MKIKNLLLLVVVAMCSMNAFAAPNEKIGSIWYNISGGKATVAGISTGIADATTITIPATITDGDGKSTKVVGFAGDWYKAADADGEGNPGKDITGATKNISIDVTNLTAVLASSEFDPFTKLESVTISGTSTIDAAYTVPQFTFAGITGTVKLDLSGLAAKSGKDLNLASYASDTKVKEISVPASMKNINFASSSIVKVNGIKEVKDGAFQSCGKLTDVILADGATIGDNAFKAAGNLANINMGKATSIGENAFVGTKVGSIDLAAAKTVKANAFNGLQVASLTIPAQVEYIADDAFDGLAKLATVEININNDKLKTIGDWFGGAAIKTLTINTPKVTKIDDNAFSAEPIEKLTITAPALKEIGANAFANYKATKIDLSELSALETVDGTSFPSATAYKTVKLAGTKIGDASFPAALNWLTSSAASLKTLTLPGKITKVPAYAFQGFTALTEVDLTKNIKTIEAYAFSGSGLTSIKISAGVQIIENNAFDGCKDLASADFSAAAELKEIWSDAFSGTKLTTIDLSACTKLDYVSGTTFPQNNYTSIKLAGTALTSLSPVQNWIAAAPDAEGKCPKNTLKEITLPGGVTAIPAGMFQKFEALTSVGLPKECITIGTYAFSESGLTAFKIRDKVTTINPYAFYKCENLATVNFSEATALTYIGTSAFEATAITEVAIPANADDNDLTIDPFTFKDCKKLKSVSAKSWAGAIDDNTFENCIKLTGIVIPVGITQIDNYAFKGCKALATVTFKYDPEATPAQGLAYLGKGVFEGCAALTALDLSAALYSNGGLYSGTNNDIFKGCTSLATVTFPAEGFTDLTVKGLFADAPIEDFDLSETEIDNLGAELFGCYYDNTGTLKARDAKNANTTLKSVKVGGYVNSYCFAYCTALENAEAYDVEGGSSAYVNAYAFEHCTALTTFTYNRDPKTSAGLAVNNDAFHGCIPFVQFVTNDTYMDYVEAWNGGQAPLNATFGGAEVTKIQTVQDKANPSQFFAKFYYPRSVSFNAEDCKIFTAYADGETVYYQACRTYDGYYNIPANRPVIIKTSEAKEVSYELGMWGATSLGWNDLYCSQEGDDLAAVQDHMHPNYNASPVTFTPMSAGEYLYRLTNTADQGFGFTFYTGTTIKAGQFFIASTKKPEGAGRLNEVWLDEDGNVEGEATGIKAVKNIDANDGAIYNLQGVRVDNPVKGGLYIQNGKKIVVK